MFKSLNLESENLKSKLDKLTGIIKSYKGAVIAFSGGIDSTLLAVLAHKILGEDSVAVTIKSEFIAKWEIEEVLELVERFKFKHRFINVNLLAHKNVCKNDKLRCKHCKEVIGKNLLQVSAETGFSYILDGSNLDDLGDYRPGFTAAKAMGIKSPFIEAEITKANIRALAHAFGLPNWDKPAAACLASRVPYDLQITEKALHSIENAESFLKGLGYTGFRVRHHDNIARIELKPEEMEKFVTRHREDVSTVLSQFGYDYVCLDLKGYRTGSLNETISRESANV